MDLLEVIMLILGILVIILSCRIVSHPDKKGKGLSIEDGGINDIYLQEKLNTLKEQQNEILTSASEEAIAKTDDYLSKLSNEKIMAVSEYSDQVLEKINKNHEEVVFLYNMLNHKEKELKETVKVIDSSQRKAKELVSKGPQEKASDKDPDKPKKHNTQAQSFKSQTVRKSAEKTAGENQPTISINNSEILKLYKQKKSVLDIARQLGIGQGEVKLVIDLFLDRNN